MIEPNIHPDFQKVLAVELPFKRAFSQALMNGGLNIAAALRFAKYKTISEHKKIAGPDGHRIPLWVIKPETITTPSATLVYFHGGGFVLKHAPQHIENAIRYAREANCRVIFVDYRMAPKHAFPAPFNDCYAALTWALLNAEALGIDKQRIAVGGDSAGGALATTVAQKAVLDGIKLCGQLLIYPVTDSDGKSPSSSAFAAVRPFKRFTVHRMWEAYLGYPASRGAPAFASPQHGNLSDLAPAYIETGEFDPLRDEGAAYAKALTANGVDVVLNETKGTVHGYDLVVPGSKISQAAIQRRVQFLRGIFQS